MIFFVLALLMWLEVLLNCQKFDFTLKYQCFLELWAKLSKNVTKLSKLGEHWGYTLHFSYLYPCLKDIVSCVHTMAVLRMDNPFSL